MKNQVRKSESPNQALVSEPSLDVEASIGIEFEGNECESEQSSISSELSDAVFMIEYSHADSSNSSSPISMFDDIDEDHEDDVRIDTNVPEKADFLPIDPAPVCSIEANGVPIVREMTTVNREPNAIVTENPLLISTKMPKLPASKIQKSLNSDVIEAKESTLINSPSVSFNGDEEENSQNSIELKLANTVNEENGSVSPLRDRRLSFQPKVHRLSPLPPVSGSPLHDKYPNERTERSNQNNSIE